MRELVGHMIAPVESCMEAGGPHISSCCRTRFRYRIYFGLVLYCGLGRSGAAGVSLPIIKREVLNEREELNVLETVVEKRV